MVIITTKTSAIVADDDDDDLCTSRSKLFNPPGGLNEARTFVAVVAIDAAVTVRSCLAVVVVVHVVHVRFFGHSAERLFNFEH